MGHFRYGPYDLHAIRTELTEEQLRQRREEIRAAAEDVNGKRDDFPEIRTLAAGK